MSRTPNNFLTRLYGPNVRVVEYMLICETVVNQRFQRIEMDRKNIFRLITFRFVFMSLLVGCWSIEQSKCFLFSSSFDATANGVSISTRPNRVQMKLNHLIYFFFMFVTSSGNTAIDKAKCLRVSLK